MKKTASNDNLVTKMEIVRDLAKKSAFREQWNVKPS